MNPETARQRQRAAAQDWDTQSQEDADDQAAFKPLTPDEAQALRDRLPRLSPRVLVTWQALAGGLCVLLWWAVSRDGAQACSALYGAIAVVLPNALMAWGVSRRPAMNAGTAVLSVMVWELIKILLVIAILVAVVKGVSDLSWPALLVTMIVSLKANWLVLLTRGRIKK